MSLLAGEATGLISRQLPAADIVRRIAAEAAEAIARLARAPG